MTFILRKMVMEDLPSVLKNEREAYKFPWSEGIFKGCLCKGDECWVISEKKIAGHAILSCAAKESHVLNLCVHPDFQGRGFGRKILDHILSVALTKGAESTFLEVRASNSIAVKLYEAMGFNEIGRRENYYPASINREDALVFGKELL
ncbi:MAG: ribosomal-protein-alanine N-acetyltransferase [Gammaproteobacteria bacterium]|nr:ribosomal-protein-alanine N-acetyltransferase [Gammaproteobacteria bacterium]